MILFPAVDIKDGKAVRLRQGKAGDVTVFADDPVDAALDWQSRGAKWLHVVDLDGAFEGVPRSRPIVERLCARVGIPVQLGGGIRDLPTARSYLDAGVERVIVGTMALEDPDGFAALCAALPGRVGVSLDAEGGRLKSRGWVAATEATVRDVLPGLVEAGAAFAVYTDIARDGMQKGVNVEALKEVATLSTVPVIAAGGVTTLEDVQRLHPLTLTTRLVGAISGRALYEGTLDLGEALAWIAGQPQT
ncbi:MAG: 1-(5-phosphoribosyl)-5-[(5-phosphoribosylamino)methylideneamino]imidazole-4-carboxamide isomerase [Desulfovibrio sp.]|jgi:phosphoribosylformimino-5-aminoimidazole carboxamide ribotide isomerase|nr:1-(5-phosphoribosyl)-5-[(5-phosphoribosylamino)methylideneamino]imidazole-4-carboxamide isomerase [Desulfovibrio sp.]